MGMIRAAGLGYEYLRYEEEGQEPEVTKAIEDVSLEIQKGQFIAVLGHNGSGKSTLAKHINALLVPTEGTMWGGCLEDPPESRYGIPEPG